eukprot:TRINITY_DN23329_c0_g1_i1.p1 TRINITY_DN23329_c0_g1~~TRINITY_DN23329_c0_g1_i1.p1  ORF type:complete len:223 (-),score=31.80 TRINITY_DN23329_c0_g1_i1:269-937(-)
MAHARQGRLSVGAKTSNGLKRAILLITVSWLALGGQLFVSSLIRGISARSGSIRMHGTVSSQVSEVADVGFREERNLSPEQQRSLGVGSWAVEAFDAGEQFGMDYTETTSVFVKSGEVDVELDPGILECFDGHKPGDGEYCETTVVTLHAGDLAVFSRGVGCEWRVKEATQLQSRKEKGYTRLANVPTATALQRMIDGEERKRDFLRSRVVRWLRKLRGISN